MPDSENREASLKSRRIWALYGARTGDNQQVSALATALATVLGGPVEEKILDYSLARALPSFLIGASRYTVREPARSQLCPPWPDIVIASGRRSVAPARWIRQQSGHKTKLVQLGRPRAALTLFDLVITTAQYGLPAAENVLSLSLPLQLSGQSSGAPSERQSQNAPVGLPDLPRPWTGLLIGGTTWPFVVNSRSAAMLAADMNRWIGKFGGSVLITTSPRSDPDVADILDRTLTAPHFLHRWQAEADNPYPAILQSADRIIVTSDSVSMLADAIRSGKPTAIWKTDFRTDPITSFCRSLGNQADKNTPMGTLLQSAARHGIFTPPRHVERLTAAIIDAGRASWFDPDRAIEIPSTRSKDSDMALAVDRVCALFD